MESGTTAPADIGTARRLRSIFSGSVGNLVEWYDWYVYTAFAFYFAPAFFPEGDATAQFLNTAIVFGIGFLLRPIGSLLLGYYADRYGRKAALVLSVLMMCGGSLLIALTPGYATIGNLAPALLVIARMLQGLSVGGEYGTSATYLSEIATSEHRGFWSSFQYVTLIMGQLLAVAVLIVLQQVFLTEAQLHEWGWRIPFAIGAVAALVSLYLRRTMLETAAFESAQRVGRSRSDLLRELLAHPRELLTVVGLTAGGTLAFYTYTTYMLRFLVNTMGFTKNTATLINAASLFVFMLLQPAVGALSDRIGRRPLLIAFGVLGTLTTVPVFHMLTDGATPLEAFGLILFALVIVSGYTSINAVVKAELFPVGVRALGVGVPYAIAVSLFGSTAEIFALKFKQAGNEGAYYWYVTACIAASLLVYLWMPDTRKHSRIDRDAHSGL